MSERSERINEHRVSANAANADSEPPGEEIV